MSNTIKVTDVGVVLEKTLIKADGTALSLLGATLVRFDFKQPDKTVVSLTGSLSGSGSDGKVRYVTTATSFTQVGHHQGQIYVEIGASQKFHTDWFHFDVGENIK
jgi:hypothetical protein